LASKNAAREEMQLKGNYVVKFQIQREIDKRAIIKLIYNLYKAFSASIAGTENRLMSHFSTLINQF